MIWREKRLLLTITGVVLLLNVVFFFTYRVRYEERLHDAETRLQASQAQLDQAHAARLAAQRQIALIQTEQKQIGEIYNDRWSTEAERLVPLIVEVKRLAAVSHLVPPAYTFSETTSKVDETGTLPSSVVGITFSVEGTYQQIRELINLLELSPQFIIIDSVGFTGATRGGTLGVTIHVKTLFKDTRPPKSAVSQS